MIYLILILSIIFIFFIIWIYKPTQYTQTETLAFNTSNNIEDELPPPIPFKGFGYSIGIERDSVMYNLNNSISFYPLLYKKRDNIDDNILMKRGYLLYTALPLGLNVIRYYAGASVTKFITHEGNMLYPATTYEENLPPTHPNYTLIDPLTDNIKDNIVTDGQLLILQIANDNGVEYVDIASRSPISYITKSNSSRGIDAKNSKNDCLDNTNTNIEDNNITKHALHLTYIYIYLITNFKKLNIYSISPMSSPSGYVDDKGNCKVWTTNNSEEGCNWDLNSRYSLFTKLVLSLLVAVKPKIAMDNEHTYSLDNVAYDKKKSNNIDYDPDVIHVQANEFINEQTVTKFKSNYYNKEIWITECKMTGVTFSKVCIELLNTFKYIDPTAYCLSDITTEWTDGYSSGYLDVTSGKYVYTNTKDKYWAIAHFSRYILPGMVRDTDISNGDNIYNKGVYVVNDNAFGLYYKDSKQNRYTLIFMNNTDKEIDISKNQYLNKNVKDYLLTTFDTNGNINSIETGTSTKNDIPSSSMISILYYSLPTCINSK